MLKNFTNIVQEKIKVEKKSSRIAIVFTDIVKSTEKWEDFPNEMKFALEKKSEYVDNILKKYKDHLIIKTLGDAYMISFEIPQNAIDFSMDLQNKLKKSPIFIGDKQLELRIGVSYGDAFKSYITVQNHKLIDYLGSIINIAVRIEGVCKPGSVAFYNAIDSIDINIDKYKTDIIKFKNKGEKVRRSGRLLTDIQRYYYKNINDLQGIKNEIDVYILYQ